MACDKMVQGSSHEDMKRAVADALKDTPGFNTLVAAVAKLVKDVPRDAFMEQATLETNDENIANSEMFGTIFIVP